MGENTTKDTKTETKRFRVNPVEVLILLTMTIVVGNSGYNLLYGTDSFHPSQLKTITAQSPLSPVDNRSLASAPTSAFANIEVKCQRQNTPETTANSDESSSDETASAETAPSTTSSAASSSSNDAKTAASKVRLTGVLCGGDGLTGAQLVKATVLNSANHFNATVFTDSDSPQFTTDYIPLTEGKNSLRIEFAYRGGKTNTQEFNVSKINE
jgi:hypothetical protein